MLAIIVTKLLLKGAIKTFVVKPIVSATMTMIPQQTVINSTLLGHEVAFSSADLLKFGIERLHEQFIERQLDFQVEKLSKYIYGVSPANEFALMFNKDYYDQEQLVVDLTRFEEYIDNLVKPLVEDFDSTKDVEFEEDVILLKVVQDLDIAIERSPKQLFAKAKDEEKLVEEILERNIELIEEKNQPLPKVPDNKKVTKSEEKDIDIILSKFIS